MASDDEDEPLIPFLVMVKMNAGAGSHERPVFVTARTVNEARVAALQASKYLAHVGRVELDVHILDESALDAMQPSRKEMAWHYWQVAQRQAGAVDVDRDLFEDEWAEYGAGRIGNGR